MRDELAAFLKDEDGAVTVDFVVLTAGVVAMALIVMPIITPGISALANFIASELGVAGSFVASTPLATSP